MSGYSYGIDALSSGTSDANFVVNQGSDSDVNVRCFSMILNSGTTLTLQGTAINIPNGTPLNTDIIDTNTLRSNSIYLRGASFVSATPVNLDFVVASVAAGFPVGSYVFFESGDGVGSFVSGYFNVGAGGNLQGLLGVTATVTAPVTAATVTFLTSILQIGWTGKATTTAGYIRLTRCAI